MAVSQASESLDQRTTEDGRKKLLEHFEPSRRSFVANTYLESIRAGIHHPFQVLTDVKHKLHEVIARSQRWGHLSDVAERNQKVLDILIDFHDEAMEYAAYCLDWERLTPEQKSRIRGVQGEQYRRAHMEQQPATDKQIAYIRGLGYLGEVTSKAHASELIERLKRGERVEVKS
jgi:hypothetical protein